MRFAALLLLVGCSHTQKDLADIGEMHFRSDCNGHMVDFQLIIDESEGHFGIDLDAPFK